MDIAVSRYNVWFADTDILQTEAGGQPFGIAGAEVRQSFANIPFMNFDPTLTTQISYDDRKTPINNPFISGTGTGTTATAATLSSHTGRTAIASRRDSRPARQRQWRGITHERQAPQPLTFSIPTFRPH